MYVRARLSRIPRAIEQLEARNLQLQESLGVVDNVLEDLGSTVTGVAVNARAKLDVSLKTQDSESSAK